MDTDSLANIQNTCMLLVNYFLNAPSADVLGIVIVGT